jgi:FUS-interacting serine-arginine-rich protein 1
MSSRHSRNLSASLYVRGLAEKVRYEDLKKIFGRYGRLVDITLPLDYYTRDAKGYGFVEYEESRDAEEALHALDRYRLFGRELEVEFARGDRKTPSEMRSREKEARYGRGGGGGGDFGRRDRSRSRDRRQRSGSPVARDRRRGGGGAPAAAAGSRSRSPHSRSPVPRRPISRSRSKSASPNYGKRNGGGSGSAARRVSRSRSPVDN